MPMALSEQRGSVVILTLNNPSQYNALAGELMADFVRVLDAAQSAPGVRAMG